MSTYIAANGQEFTDAMIDHWCAAYERGDFPVGERTAGEVVYGRPASSRAKDTVLSIKMPEGMKAAVARKAELAGMSPSSYARKVLADDLLAVS